jgi:hypothetical protein
MSAPIRKERRQRSDALLATPDKTFIDIIDTITCGGGGLYKWCRVRDVPYTRFKDWIDNDPDRRTAYEQALVASADAHVAIAQALMDSEPKLLENGAVDNGWVNWRKTQAGFHQWLSGRLMPRRYGESVEIVTQNHVNFSLRSLLDERDRIISDPMTYAGLAQRVDDDATAMLLPSGNAAGTAEVLEIAPTATANTHARETSRETFSLNRKETL